CPGTCSAAPRQRPSGVPPGYNLRCGPAGPTHHLPRPEDRMRFAVPALAVAAALAPAPTLPSGHPQPPAKAPEEPPAKKAGKTHQLKPGPKTVAWGYYDAAAKPVLRIASGDTVEVETLITSSPQGLERAFVPADQVEQALRDVFKEVSDKGPGGHILTGPIYVEGAEPGDTLEVRVKDVRLLLPYAYTAFGPKSGFLPEDFPRSRTKIIPLDTKRMVGRF